MLARKNIVQFSGCSVVPAAEICGTVVSKFTPEAVRDARIMVAHYLRLARDSVRIADLGAACAALDECDYYAECMLATDARRYQEAATIIHRRMVSVIDRKAVRT